MQEPSVSSTPTMLLVQPEEEKKRTYSVDSLTHLIPWARTPRPEPAVKLHDVTYPNYKKERSVSLTIMKDAPAATNSTQAIVLRIAP